MSILLVKGSSNVLKRMRIAVVCLTVGILQTASFVSVANAQSKAVDTHILAIGACPPWKGLGTEPCRLDVESVTNALQKRLSIPNENVNKLINEQATTGGLIDIADKLSKREPMDRLIVYVNLHNGAASSEQKASAKNDVMVFWTIKQPQVSVFAIAQGLWMAADDFAALMHKIPAKELILIMDACESDALSNLFVHEHKDNNPERPEAIIVSAKADQTANFTKDRTMGLFSQILSEKITNTNGQLIDAVNDAAKEATAMAIPICDSFKQDNIANGRDPKSCRQQPQIHDPANLLSEIKLMSSL
jgi:hypothetical protein